MIKLWDFKDYVERLSHKNALVRQWAYEPLEQRHRDRYADEVRILLDDEDARMVSNALRYFSYHKAIQYAPTILEKFESSSGIIGSNAAIALSKMEYEPAIDTILEHFYNPDSQDKFSGMLDYLGHIENEKCREALRAAVDNIGDDLLLRPIFRSLFLHRNTEDIDFVLNRVFESAKNASPDKIALKDIANALDGGRYFDGLAYGGDSNIWLEPKDTLGDFSYFNVQIELDTDKFDEIVAHIEQGHYENLVTMLAFDARSIIQNRYPNKPIPEQLKKLNEKDLMCLAMLENLSKRSPVWKNLKKEESPAIIPFVMAIYFAIKERDAYAQVLGAEEVSVDALIRALEKAGPSMPIEVQRKIQEGVPVNDLKGILTDELDNWCDIWTVRIMGEKGNIEFIPELLRVFRESDSLDFIYSDAEYALRSMDESADEILLSAVQNHELGAWESIALLERLPYSEAYDAAIRIWESKNSDMDSYEAFAICLQDIGDIRGIEKLQEIYHEENDAEYIGDAMECLGALHSVDIPELPDIMEKRRQRRELHQSRRKELNDLARQYNTRVEKGDVVENVVPFKRGKPKVGRNEPCPCGSGKKYKKCCMDKD